MRCTSRKTGKSAAIICLVAVFLSGCGEQQYDMAYSKDYAVSNFQIGSTESIGIADSFASVLCVASSDVTDGTDVDASGSSSVGLFDVNDSEVIYAKNIHEKLYPASLTKVMTALVALKYGNMDDTITATGNVKIEESGAQLAGLSEGDTLTMDQALHILLIYSANDVAVAIAEHVAGSVDAFAEMMNEEAKAIGATNSNFVNPHGLSDDNHYVSAYDMYLMFNEAVKYDEFNEIIHMSEYDTVYYDKNGDSKEFKCDSTNGFLRGDYSSPDGITVIGGKTGTTNAAGNCLVLLSKDSSGHSYISVVMKAEDKDVMYSETADLLDEITN